MTSANGTNPTSGDVRSLVAIGRGTDLRTPHRASWGCTPLSVLVPRFRALALFGRRSPQCVESLVMPASENLHISGSHSILVVTGEHLAAMVIRAARLAAILLPIARGLRPAEKGGARL